MTNKVFSPKDQLEIIKNLHKSIKIKEGDTVYLINTNWIKKWLEFVQHSVNKSSNKHYCGKINNEVLLWQDEFDKNNRFHVNYEYVPEEIWNQFIKWYGGGPEIIFNIIDTGKQLIPDIDKIKLSIIYKNLKYSCITNQNLILSKFKSIFYNFFKISPEKVLYIKNLNDENINFNDDISLYENHIYNNDNLHVKSRNKHDDSNENSDTIRYSEAPTQTELLIPYSDINKQTKKRKYNKEIQVNYPKTYLAFSKYTSFEIKQRPKENFKIDTQEIFEIKQRSKENFKIDTKEILEIKQRSKESFRIDKQEIFEIKQIN